MNRSASLVDALSCLLVILFCTTTSSANSIEPDTHFDYSTIKSRVEQLECFVRTKYNSDIEKHIRGFVLLARNNSKRILGDATIYFPTIENKIRQLNLPDDLKYLTVVESMLDPRAVSQVGAKGMWQLMPFIAADYNLSMNGLVDERFHVEKSAEAGLLYLKKLYNRFENWELALAAYNCGPNRLRRILQNSKVKSYWGIRHLLPKQTREFVPKLIAVKYLFKYYQHHGIEPSFPTIDLQLTNTISINTSKSFTELSNLLGVKSQIITALNPSLKYDPVKSGLTTIDLRLPARVIEALSMHTAISEIAELSDNNFRVVNSDSIKIYHKLYYTVESPVDLRQFCIENDLSYTQVRLWNNLYEELLVAGQKIFVYNYQELRFSYNITKGAEEIHSFDVTPLNSLNYNNASRGNIFTSNTIPNYNLN